MILTFLLISKNVNLNIYLENYKVTLSLGLESTLIFIKSTIINLKHLVFSIDIRSFFNVCDPYLQFIANYTSITISLINLMKKVIVGSVSI